MVHANQRETDTSARYEGDTTSGKSRSATSHIAFLISLQAERGKCQSMEGRKAAC